MPVESLKSDQPGGAAIAGATRPTIQEDAAIERRRRFFILQNLGANGRDYFGNPIY